MATSGGKELKIQSNNACFKTKLHRIGRTTLHFSKLGPGQPSAGGPRMDRRAVTHKLPVGSPLMQKRYAHGAPTDLLDV